ncbi:MAG: hypothetical protein PHV43_00180 [Candidatus Colwellbacteria bacterium]|nr:hypothetical protein [Candidatus Colwellbacteria bacterium]
MSLIRMNLLRRKGVQADSQGGSGNEDSPKIITPHHLGGGLAVSKRPVVRAQSVSRLKVYAVIIISALAAFTAGYLFSIWSFAYGAIALVVFTVLFTTQTILLRRPLDIILVVAADSIGLALFLNKTSSSVAVCLLVVLVVMFGLSHLASRFAMDNMVQLKFFRVVRPGSGFLFIALSVFAGCILFLNSATLLNTHNTSRVMDALVQPILSRKVAGFSAEMDLGNFLHDYVRAELSKNEQFKGLPELEKEKVITAQVAELAVLIENRSGYGPQMAQSVAENVREFISIKAGTLYPENQLARLALTTLILILVVKSIEFLLFPVLAILSLLLYEFLLGFGFAEIQFESRSKEILNLPSRRP